MPSSFGRECEQADLTLALPINQICSDGKRGLPQPLSTAGHGVPDHRIITAGILQHGEMAGILEDDKFCARDLLCHHLRMVELDGFIVIAVPNIRRQREEAFQEASA